MTIDTVTFYFAFACIATVSSVTMLAEWYRTRQESIGFWSAGFIVVTIVVTLRFSAGNIGVPAETIVPALASLSYCFLAQGSLVFSGRRPIASLYLLPALWFVLLLARWAHMPPAESRYEQAAYGLLAQALPCLVTALAFARFQRGTVPGTLVVVVFGLQALFLAWRGFHIEIAKLLPVTTTDDPLAIFVAMESLIFFSVVTHLLLGAAKDAVAVRWKTAAEIDALTGLLGRSAFLKVCEERLGADRPGALAMVDLDHFKSVNDEYGHGVGDEALRVFSRIVSASLGECGILGRLGGEEFAILIDGDSTVASARVSEALRMFTQGSGVLLPRPLTASAGLVSLRPGAGVEALLLQADQALYKAKAGGRNRVVEVPEADWTVRPSSARISPA